MTNFSKILERAKLGDSQAQCELAWAYDSGKGVRKSFRSAAYWYRKSAKQDHPIAQYNLSLYYLLGQGVRKDLAKSFVWNRSAAESGDEDAQLAMGWFYHGGRGVKPDLNKAKTWYLKAARKGNTSAMFSLGQMAYDQKHFKEAIRWFSKASKLGHPRSNYYLGSILLYGKGIPSDPFRAKKCLEAAADTGVGYAKRLLNGGRLKRLLLRENNVAVNRWRKGALLPAI